MPDGEKYQFSFSRSMGVEVALAKGGQLLAILRSLKELHAPLTALSDHLDRLEGALVGLKDHHESTRAGNKTRIPAREKALDEVIDYLNRIGNHVRLATWENTALRPAAGFDLVKPKASTSPTLVAVAKFTVKNLDEDGAVVCAGSTVKGAKNYEIRYTSEDPTVDTWPGKEFFSHVKKMKIPGLVQGKKYYFQIRPISANGDRGPWSATVGLFIT